MPDNFINHLMIDCLDKNIPNNPAQAKRTKIATVLHTLTLSILLITDYLIN
tara:strand:+ start:404 stop:556 length:153 start_codon:yes stop_codon:yes gene_type:complete